MKHVRRLLILIALCHWNGTAAAQIVRDGTAGPDASAQPMADANGRFVIDETLGALLGDNADALLHSFRDFSILSGQEALFTGNASIQTIISRVTGASPSMIDGALSSAIPGAHFFLLNPRGVVFGADATLNMAGPLSVSTADTLMFSDGEALQVYSGGTLPVLRSAIPADFGFLGAGAASIELNGANLGSAAAINLNAGDVALRGESEIASLTDVSITASSVDIGAGANINVFSASDRSVPGNIVVRAQQQVRIDGATGNASLFTIGQQGFTGGVIDVQAREIRLENGAQLLSRNNSDGVSNDIRLTATDAIRMSGVNADGKGVTLFSNTGNMQTAGAIALSAPVIDMTDGADILSANPGGGDAGAITLTASGALTLSGNDSLGGFVDQANIQAISSSAGNAGVIEITVGSLTLDNGARIQSSSENAGNANDITIAATDSVTLSGNDPTGGFGSSISSTALGFGQAGNAGNIVIRAPRVALNDGARISSGSVGGGDGGDIVIEASESLILSGQQGIEAPPDAIEGNNNGARIEVQAFDGSTGDAGSITINTGEMMLSDKAIVLSNAFAGEGGDIAITADRIVNIGSDIVSSVRSDQGNGGDILIAADLLVLGDSDIRARAAAGNGGTIDIQNVARYVALAGSTLDASSESGLDGTVIAPPELTDDFGGDPLRTEFLDVTDLLRSSCANYREDGQFRIAARRGVAASPEGLLPGVTPVQLAERAMNVQAAGVSRAGPRTTQEWDALVLRSARASDAKAHAEALRGRSQAAQAQGDYQSAAQALTEALTLARSADDPFRVAASLGELGNVLLATGRDGRAVDMLRDALNVAATLDAPELSARLYTNLGNSYMAGGAHERALDAYRRAATALAARASTDSGRLVAARVDANLARVHIDRGDVAAARDALRDAASAIPRTAADGERASLLIHLAKSHETIAAQGDGYRGDSLIAAYTHLREAEALSLASDDPRLLSYALGNQGALYRIEGRLDEALILTRRALRAAERAQAAESVYRWHWQEGRLLQGRGESDRAIASYRRAIEVIDASRQATLARYDSARTYFNQLVAPVYLEQVGVLLDAEAATLDVARSQSLLREARATIEQFKSAELKNYFQDECVLRQAAQQRAVDEVAAGTAVVYPIALADRLELLVSLPGARDGRRIARYRVPVDADELDRRVRVFRERVDSLSDAPDLMANAQWLYARLVGPYREDLEANSVDTLVFVPTGMLRLVPLAALHDGRQYLVRRYALATTSGLSLTDPRPLPKRNNRVLLSGISEPVGDFPALDDVPGELEAVRALYGGDVLLNDEFTAARFEQKIRDTDYSIIHIASHAQFTGDPSGNFLRAFDKPIYLTDFNRALSAVKYRERPLELLVLSACQTASGDERAALGLAGVGIRAGARSALASLWSIDDESAARLIEHFYGNLRNSDVSKAEALRQAQLALLDQPRFAHPFHWSAFLLIDNWL